jgi:putative ABC transport system substrate-binding protein
MLAGVGAWVAPARAGSRTGREVPLVGVLAATGLSSLDYLRQGLRAQGHVEGKSVAFAFRSADGNPRDLPGLARHLARLNVDVLFVAGPAALDAAVHATSEIPIVALDLETDPLRSGLVRSLEHPRTNVTGVFLDQPALVSKWFELLRLTLPRARQLNLLWDAGSGPWQLAAAKQAAGRLGFEADTLVVRSEADFERELAEGMDRKPEALVLLSSPLVRARSQQIADFSVKQRLPTISPFGEFPRAGGLMSYGPNVGDFYLRAAGFVDKVLKGSRAGDQPIAMPTQFEQVLNQRAARALGLTLPAPMLAAATEVIG